MMSYMDRSARKRWRWGVVLVVLGVLFLAEAVMFGLEVAGSEKPPPGASVAERDGKVHEVGAKADRWVLPDAGDEDLTVRVGFDRIESIGGYGRTEGPAEVVAGGAAEGRAKALAVRGDDPWPKTAAVFEEQLENQARSDPFEPEVDVLLSGGETLSGKEGSLRVALQVLYPVEAEKSGEDTLGDAVAGGIEYVEKPERLERTLELTFVDEDAYESMLTGHGETAIGGPLGAAGLGLAASVGGVLLMRAAKRG